MLRFFQLDYRAISRGYSALPRLELSVAEVNDAKLGRCQVLSLAEVDVRELTRSQILGSLLYRFTLLRLILLRRSFKRDFPVGQDLVFGARIFIS